MPTITIDGRSIEVAAGTSILQAAERLGIRIPTLCHLEGIEPQTACMVCVVRIEGRKGLAPACATVVEDGMVVESETQDVIDARRTALELMLSDHVGDCVGPCQTTCPALLDIPGMIRLIAEQRLDEALALVRERIPFPAVLGRICPELCEKGCRRGYLDAPVSIKLLKRYVGDYGISMECPQLPQCAPATGKRVAIVGAGPAGLSAAWYLRIAGHSPTVYDDREQPGGMLRYGVSEQDLPPGVLDAEIDMLVGLGIELRREVRVGDTLSLEDIGSQVDACIVAIGDISTHGGAFGGLPVDGNALAADRQTHQSPVDNVFVAGAARAPSRYAVTAVAEGRSVAHAVDLFLRGLRPERAGRPYSTRIGRMENDELRHLAAETPRHGRVRLTTGWPGGFSDTEARLEAARCLHCECAKLNTCRLRQTGLEYGADTARYRGQRRPFRRDMSHPLLVYEPGKCIACGLCIQIARRSGEQLGLSFVGRGYDVEMAAPFGRPISEGLVVAACACAEACPTAALTLREDMAHAILPEPEPPIEFRRRAMPGRPFGRWRRRRTWGS